MCQKYVSYYNYFKKNMLIMQLSLDMLDYLIMINLELLRKVNFISSRTSKNSNLMQNIMFV